MISSGRVRPLVLFCALLPLIVSSLGCSKEQASDKESTSASPLPASEVERGRKACEAYVERLCACAETHTELAEDCTLAKALPQAFELNVELSATPGLPGAEQSAVKVEARKIAAACFEDDGKLDPETCPRTGTRP